MRVWIQLMCLLAAGALIASTAVHAQTWPTQTVRIIVPFPPGGTTDQVARLLQPYLQQSLGVPVVVDNRGGASGAIGSGMAAKAPPDGYTFLLVFDTHGVNPSLIPNMPFDTLKDLAPIMLLGKSPMVITAHPAFPYKSFAEVVRLAKAKPGVVTFGTIGSGSLAHLAMAMITGYAKVEMTHIPYKGGGPLIINAIGGHVPMAIASLGVVLAAHPVGPVEGDWHHFAEAASAIARGRDRRRTGDAGFRSRGVVGIAGARKHAGTDTHARACGSHQGAEDSGAAATPRSAGAGGGGFVARGVPEIPGQRSRALGARRARQQNKTR